MKDGFLKIVFVKTTENVADIFTKNLPQELKKRHTRKMLSEKKSKQL